MRRKQSYLQMKGCCSSCVAVQRFLGSCGTRTQASCRMFVCFYQSKLSSQQQFCRSAQGLRSAATPQASEVGVLQSRAEYGAAADWKPCCTFTQCCHGGTVIAERKPVASRHANLGPEAPTAASLS